MPFILQKSNGKIIHVQRFFLVQIEIHRMSSRIMRPFQYPVSGRAWQTVLFPDIEKPDIRTNMQQDLYKRTSHDVFFSKTSLLQVEKHTGCKVIMVIKTSKFNSDSCKFLWQNVLFEDNFV